MFKSRSAVWALDFGASTVTAVAARRKPSGDWAMLGGGEAEARGRVRGEIVKMTDVVESVVEALRKTERSAGLRCRKLYFNFEDAGSVSAHPSGSKALSGEGQIRREDVREAVQGASRLVGDFERTPVYARETNYLIDGKDSVGNPFGVFGHRLDVALHVVLARAAVFEQWKNVMRRAQLERFAPVLSLDAACHAVLERKSSRRIVWDAGEDTVSGGVFEKGVLRDYAIFLSEKPAQDAETLTALSRAWTEKHGVEEPLLVTGDQAALEKFTQAIGLKFEVGSPKAVPSLAEPRRASLAGLLQLAAEREKSSPSAKVDGRWMGQVREKASALIQEYF